MPSPDAASLLRVELRDAVDDAEWESLVARDPRAGVGQRPGFVRALAGADARWMEARDDAGTLQAGLPLLVSRRGPWRSYVSGAGGTFAGPVAAPDAEAGEQRLARAFSALGGPLTLHRELVWRHRDPPRGRWRGLEPLPMAVLDLDPASDFETFVTDAFGRTRRKEYRRGERMGLRVRRTRDVDAWESFRPVLAEREREWGSRLPSPDTIARLLDAFEEVELFVLHLDGETKGVHVVLWYPDELFSWIGSTARMQGVGGATFLIREEARAAHQAGRRQLNLGSSVGIAGVQNFKHLMGARSDPRWIVREMPRWRRWRRGRR